MNAGPHNWAIRPGASEPGPCAVFDLDGVLSDAAVRQHFIERPGWRDWDAFFSACGDDPLLEETATLLHLLDASLGIVLLTARPLWVQPETLSWLTRYGLRWDVLIMRPWGDYMRAADFKRESLWELRDAGWNVRLAFEDDPRNLAMFRSEGVPCVYIHSGYYTS
ncbi:MAG: phosphatase domain-containing protein [Acidimicrobiales bacterium]